MTKPAEKYTATIDEAVAHLVSRAENSRGLNVVDIKPRVGAALQKYLFVGDASPANTEVKEFIDEIRADDLCLIIACEQGDERAWEDLVANFDSTVKSAARKITSNAEDAEDLASSIWAELYGLRIDAAGNKKSKLAYYSGRGSLAGWLRAVVAQLAVDQHRKQSRLVQTEEDADFDRIIQHGQDETTWSGHGAVVNPELQISTKFAGAQMQKALAESVKQMSAEDRLLVKLYYFDGLRLREAGAVLGVHEATASRRLTRIHAELRQKVESVLMKEHGWTQAEAARSLAEVATQLQTDVEPMLMG